MQGLLKFFVRWRSVIGEAFIIFILLFTINNFIGYDDKTIKSDGAGYYDLLPSIFIYHDLPHFSEASNSKRIDRADFYKIAEGSKANKFHTGTAVLLMPFFLSAHFTSHLLGYPSDGFSFPYPRAVLIAAFFYLFFGLVFLRKTLRLFKVGPGLIFVIELLAVLATPIINYVNYDSSFSHVYSFFAINAFSYFARSYFLYLRRNTFLYACLFYGLIVILRPVNGIIIFFLPFLAGSAQGFKVGIINLFQLKKVFLAGILLSASVIFIQSFLWYYQTGHFFVYSYVGESFKFLPPAFADFLFSYRKGLFVYTPLLLIMLPIFLLFFFRKEYFLLSSFVLFLLLTIYVLSSWWCWWYGPGFGTRPFIDFYIAPFIALGLLLKNVKIWIRAAILAFSFLCVPLNVIQANQYKETIFSEEDMDKQKYWMVFLHREFRFKGIFYKANYDLRKDNTQCIYAASIRDCSIQANKKVEVFSVNHRDITGFENVNMIRIKLDNDFIPEDDTRVEVVLLDSVGKNSSLPVNFYPPAKLVKESLDKGYLIHY